MASITTEIPTKFCLAIKTRASTPDLRYGAKSAIYDGLVVVAVVVVVVQEIELRRSATGEITLAISLRSVEMSRQQAVYHFSLITPDTRVSVRSVNSR